MHFNTTTTLILVKIHLIFTHRSYRIQMQQMQQNLQQTCINDSGSQGWVNNFIFSNFNINVRTDITFIYHCTCTRVSREMKLKLVTVLLITLSTCAPWFSIFGSKKKNKKNCSSFLSSHFISFGFI